MSTVSVTGRVGDIAITKPIYHWPPAAEEAIPTAKKDICRKFEEMAFNKEDVTFTDDSDLVNI